MPQEFEFTFMLTRSNGVVDPIHITATTQEGKDFMKNICRMILNGEIKCNTQKT